MDAHVKYVQVFEEVVHHERHEYANAETTDLWDATEDSTGQPVRALMDSWIFQAGYPLVSVARTAAGLVLSVTRGRRRLPA